MVDVTQKRCFKCEQIKPVTEFYAHPAMADGRLGKCKECTKSDVQKNYADKREQYSAYDRERQQQPYRRAKKLEYQRTARAKNPGKNHARAAVGRALRHGQITKPEHCSHCGATAELEAHHTDYSRPLDVLWLCFTCHREYGHGQTVTQKQ